MKYQLPQPYEELDHTADIGVIVRGPDEAATLARLVLAMSQLLTGGGPLVPTESHTFEVEPSDLPNMAIDVLRELLFRFDTQQLIAAACSVERIDPATGTRVTVDCGRRDPALHEEGTDLKAVTLHAARFEREGDGWVAQIVFDV